jgi:hypothetical protein
MRGGCLVLVGFERRSCLVLVGFERKSCPFQLCLQTDKGYG